MQFLLFYHVQGEAAGKACHSWNHFQSKTLVPNLGELSPLKFSFSGDCSPPPATLAWIGYKVSKCGVSTKHFHHLFVNFKD